MDEHYFDIPDAAVCARAREIKLLALDVDGVLTDGHIYMGAQGELMKAFHIQDGKGVNMLRQAGIDVAIVTARESEFVLRRAEELKIEHVLQGRQDKWSAVESLLVELGLEPAQLAFAGDDLVDVPVLRRAGLAVAVANAHPFVRCHSHWQTRRAGGSGAVRELCELILHAQGLLEAQLERYALE